MKKFFKIMKFPTSIFVGGFAYFWLVTNPLETYTLPAIIIWLPDVIGWNGFFIFLGILAGLLTLAICANFAGELDN
tara:strand:- start:1097 stop:1324 length:228 start_codon:yes stop_codon:yes gene_type:complete